MQAEYDGRQFVGIDLHRRAPSVVGRAWPVTRGWPGLRSSVTAPRLPKCPAGTGAAAL